MNWHACRLGDVITLKRGHDLPEGQRQDGEVPVVSSSGITGYHNEPKAKAPGVVTGRYGTLGEVFYIDQDYWPLNTALYVTDFKDNHPRFVAYLLENVLRNYQSDKAAVPGVNRNVLHDLKVRCADPTSQQKIAYVLSTYDDLIENNRRRMELLEEAARQLYREWFVRLRFPGCEHTRTINGVPEGWCTERVGSVLAKIESKKKIPKEGYLPEGPIPCVDQSAEFIGGFTDDEDSVYAQPLPIIVFGDHTRILKFVNFPFARGADGTQIIYSNTDRISSEYLYLSLKEIDLSNYFYARHFKFLKEKELRLPEASLVREFTTFARPCFEQVQTLRLQNQKLRTARDLLLPRLMNGEIAV
jgi:type I restriction enzyme S subunit